MSILIAILLGVWMLVALLMMLVILMQRPKSEGLGAAFGGAMTENLFGAQTTNVLVKFTAWLAGIFFAITFTLSVLYAHRSMGGSSLSRELKKGATVPLTAPAASPAPAGQSSPVAVSPGKTGVGFVPTGSASPAAPATSPATSAAVQPGAVASPPASNTTPAPGAGGSPKP